MCAIIAPLPAVCAVFTTITFVFWFAGVMAPDHEKYKYQGNDKRNRIERGSN